MIEKIPFKTEELCFNNKMQTVQVHASPYDLQVKINELVDAVNVLQAQVAILQEHAHPTATTEQTDPYAEQIKWIGKLCKFWDDDAFITSKDWGYGMLTSIDKGMQYQYCCNEISNFKHCEPVKPDDDIIFKGE